MSKTSEAKVLVGLRCIGTFWLKDKKTGKDVQKFEDYYGDDRDIYEVDEDIVNELLASGNFERV